MKKIKVLHIVGGPITGGAFQGSFILHRALLKLGVNSKILNDTFLDQNKIIFPKKKTNIVYLNKDFKKKVISKIFIYLEKILKSLFLKINRSTFTIGITGYDLTKLKEYKTADIIHIHWLNQGFINLKSIKKIKKPVVWTMRDMWPFTSGAHYTIDFESFERSSLSKVFKRFKKKNYPKQMQFVAISNWLKKEAKKSSMLKDFKIRMIYNNINTEDFRFINKEKARSILNINTKKNVILFGSQNTQSMRKGWECFVETLKKLNKSDYYLLIFGNFWSHKILDDIGIEYKSLGFIGNKKTLNAAYSSSDFFVFPSLQEAFGKTWAEAMICKIPIICFKNTSASEFVKHKKTGFVVKNMNSESLKKGIDWMSNKINRKNFLNEKKNNKVKEFDVKYIAKKYIQLYSELL